MKGLTYCKSRFLLFKKATQLLKVIQLSLNNGKHIMDELASICQAFKCLSFRCTPCLFLVYLSVFCACLLHGTAARFTLNFVTSFPCEWPNLMSRRKLFYKPQLLTPVFYKVPQVYCQFKAEAKTLMLRMKGYKNIPWELSLTFFLFCLKLDV